MFKLIKNKFDNFFLGTNLKKQSQGMKVVLEVNGVRTAYDYENIKVIQENNIFYLCYKFDFGDGTAKFVDILNSVERLPDIDTTAYNLSALKPLTEQEKKEDAIRVSKLEVINYLHDFNKKKALILNSDETRNFNTGMALNFREVMNDKERAIKDFAEGNADLERLLSFCFANNIATKACCAGHVGGQEPYISFEFSDQNRVFIENLLLNLHECEYLIAYNKSASGSHFSISDSHFKQTLFKDIHTVLSNTNKEEKYEYQLPDDLKEYLSLTSNCEMNPDIVVNKSGGANQLFYHKEGDMYQYSYIVFDSEIRKMAIKLGFKEVSENRFFGLLLEDSNRDKLANQLRSLNNAINPKAYFNKVFRALKNLKNTEDYKKIHVADGTVIYAVADELMNYKELGIKACADFNGTILVNDLFESIPDILMYIAACHYTRNPDKELFMHLYRLNKTLNDDYLREKTHNVNKL